jgi:hypothetical protein
MDDWRDELAAVPRDRFVPDLIWLDTDNGYVALRKTDDPAAWHASVAADEPIVTQDDPEDDYRHIVHLRDHASSSSATVVVAGAPPFDVRQCGPRPLWTEVETAYRWWVDAGKPAPERFGITVSPDGQATWLDSPDARLTRPPGRR